MLSCSSDGSFSVYFYCPFLHMTVIHLIFFPEIIEDNTIILNEHKSAKVRFFYIPGSKNLIHLNVSSFSDAMKQIYIARKQRPGNSRIIIINE